MVPTFGEALDIANSISKNQRTRLAVSIYCGFQVVLPLYYLRRANQKFLREKNSSETTLLVLSMGQAFCWLIPAIFWNIIFMWNFVWTVMVAWSSSVRVPLILMLCVGLLYDLSLCGVPASTLDVIIYGPFTMSGPLFLSLVLLVLVPLYSRCVLYFMDTNQDRYR